MSETSFVHLQCQSEYSIKNSLIQIPKLIDKAKELNMDCIALTEDSNLFSAIKFYKYATQKGIKPIFGVKIVIDCEKYKYSVLLLCQNNRGYINLCELISTAYTEKQDLYGPLITEKYLQQYNQGLILIASAIKSDVAKSLLKRDKKEAVRKVHKWRNIFDNRYYLAVQRTSKEYDEKHLHLTIDLAAELDIPVIATNDVQFLLKADFEAHEARVCISKGEILEDPRRVSDFNNSQYLKSSQEMKKLFADFPQILQNTVEVSKRCNLHFNLFKQDYFLPVFPTPQNISIVDFFKQECKKGLNEKLKNEKLDKKLYQERLNFEIDVILKMNFPGYFLIVYDFIRWAKENDIPVGPGRGSGAGSLVAWALSITNINPIKHGLIFERFLNPERISMPDFDIDFCAERRDEVIAYVANKYGQKKVSQIITYGTMAAKAVIRDAGRVLGNNYGFNDSIAKLIPNKLSITLEEALEESTELQSRYKSEEGVTTLIDLSQKLEGLVRNAGTHAGGVVIAPSKISDFCPVYKGPNEEDVLVSQFDKDDIEAVGLVKFDFLGLSNLTMIDRTIKMLFAKGLTKEIINIDNLPLDDHNVYKILKKCDTTGVFQLESEGMRGYLKKLKADSFEDIVAMLALYRPGPLEAKMVDIYIDVKHGAKPSYPHPILEEILKSTNSIFLYQEQVMETAQLMAGYSMGKADLLRQAISKKNTKEMAEQRKYFIKGAIKNGIDEKKSSNVFDLIEKFAGYGFNKSHSVAYAYISYQTAWLKSYYPAAFMASVLSGFMDDTDRIAFIVSEAKKINLIIKPPNINESEYQFSILDKKTIIYGLGAIKGVGESLVQEIVSKRENGKYIDMFDFCLRINKKFLNRRSLEALILSGFFDILGTARDILMNKYLKILMQAEKIKEDKENGQIGLFTGKDSDLNYKFDYSNIPNISFNNMLKKEKSVMGYYLNKHPTDFFKLELEFIKCRLPSEIIFRNNRDIRVLGLISDIKYRDTNKGQIANIVLQDSKITINTVLFREALSKYVELLKIDDMVVVIGKINKDFRDNWQIIAEELKSISDIRTQNAKYLLINFNNNDKEKFKKLREILKNNNGNCPVIIKYTNNNAYAKLPLSQNYSIAINDNLIESLDLTLGKQGYEIKY